VPQTHWWHHSSTAREPTITGRVRFGVSLRVVSLVIKDLVLEETRDECRVFEMHSMTCALDGGGGGVGDGVENTLMLGLA